MSEQDLRASEARRERREVSVRAAHLRGAGGGGMNKLRRLLLQQLRLRHPAAAAAACLCLPPITNAPSEGVACKPLPSHTWPFRHLRYHPPMHAHMQHVHTSVGMCAVGGRAHMGHGARRGTHVQRGIACSLCITRVPSHLPSPLKVQANHFLGGFLNPRLWARHPLPVPLPLPLLLPVPPLPLPLLCRANLVVAQLHHIPQHACTGPARCAGQGGASYAR